MIAELTRWFYFIIFYTIMTEQWKDIIWYEWKYQVSDLWNIKNIVSGYVFKKRIWSRWYHIVILYLNWKSKILSVHRLIAKAFIPNPENKAQINHINWIRSDNSLNNLEWVTPSENQIHKFRVLWYKMPDYQIEALRKSCSIIWKTSRRNKKVNQFSLDWVFIKEWDSLTLIGNELWLSLWNISWCCTWNWKCKTAYGFIWKFK